MKMAGVKDVARDAGLNPVKCPDCAASIDTIEAVRAMFRAILRRCRMGERVIIKDFGVFEAKVLRGRKVISPLLPGGEGKFDDVVVLRFRSAVNVKKSLNKKELPVRKKKGKQDTNNGKGKKNVRREG